MRTGMFSPPLPDTGFIERNGIIAQMSAVPKSCILYIHAPAGFGKTTAVAQWLAGQKAVWFTPDEYAAARFYGGILNALGKSTAASEITPESFLDVVQSISVWPSALVIDDLHIGAGPDVLFTLPLLRARMPIYTSMILISRVPLPEALNEQFMKGIIRTVTGFQFSADEIAALFRKRGKPITNYAAGLLQRQTGGWAAALSGLLDSGDTGYSGIANHESIRRYLKGFDMERIDDLKKCAICDVLHPSLCAAITGRTDTWAYINEFSNQTGLITESSGGTVRFHPLLRDFLEGELLRDGDIDKPSLYAAAAIWYKGSGDWFRALSMAAKSGDLAVMDYIAYIPVNHAVAVNVTDYAALVEEHFLSLPLRITQKYPNLALHCYAGALLIRPIDEADRWKEFLEARDSLQSGNGAKISELPTLTGNFPFFHKGLRDFTDMSPNLPAFLNTAAERDRVLASLKEAGILYERGELAKAESIIVFSGRLPPEIFFCAYALHTEIRRNQGKKTEPERIGEMIERTGASFLQNNYTAFQTETELFAGDRTAAEIWINRTDPDELPRLHNLYRSFVTARALLALDRLSEAEALLDKLAPISWEYRRNADFIEAHTLLAVCRWRMKRPDEALEAAVPALVRASGLGLIMPIAREGNDILPVLQKTMNRLKYGYDSDRLDRAYINVLYRHAKRIGGHVPGLFAGHTAVRLSPRQTEVLRYLEQNMSYREIAQKMGISTATVDDHIRKLHEKLDASSTRELLNRAWDLGV